MSQIDQNTPKKSRKKKVGIIAGALVIGTGAAAFAYWTADGSGVGSVDTGTTTDTLVVNQTSVLTPLEPGIAAQTLSGNFDNDNDGPIYVGTVTASISSVTDALGDPIVGCDATDYTLTDAAMTVNAQVPVGADQGSWTGADLAFNNKAGSNQDACKLAVVHLAYAIS